CKGNLVITSLVFIMPLRFIHSDFLLTSAPGQPVIEFSGRCRYPPWRLDRRGGKNAEGAETTYRLALLWILI
ncbi:MAG: hypothetical protein ACXVKH_03905, partial [Candidatus Angelobacter sp.]